MIENEQTAWNHEEHLRQMEVVTVREWNFRFEKIDSFVTEKPDSAASKSRQFRVRNEPINRHQFADFVERIGGCIEPMLVAAFDESDFASITLDDNPRLDPDERESSRHVIFFSRFKEKAVTGVIKFLKR